MAADAITLITEDHRLLDGLLERLLQDDVDRLAVVEEITARLTAHARAEEREVYPSIMKADPNEADEVEHAYEEHVEAEHDLRKVRNLIGSPHFEEAAAAFVAAVRHHVEEEESEVLPALQNAVDTATLRRLGAAFAKERDQQLKSAGFTATRRPRKGGDVDTAQDDRFADVTRDELYEMAKKADVAGRSSMTKDELADALRQQR
jgi:hemerythrin-like domain-containing protein